MKVFCRHANTALGSAPASMHGVIRVCAWLMRRCGASLHMLAAPSPCTVSNCSFVLVDCHMRLIQAALTCPFAIIGDNASRGERRCHESGRPTTARRSSGPSADGANDRDQAGCCTTPDDAMAFVFLGSCSSRQLEHQATGRQADAVNKPLSQCEPWQCNCFASQVSAPPNPCPNNGIGRQDLRPAKVCSKLIECRHVPAAISAGQEKDDHAECQERKAEKRQDQ